MDKTIQVVGMTCASCVNHVEKALKSIDGVIDATVNLATEKARIRSLREIPNEVIQSAVEAAGYQALIDIRLDPAVAAQKEKKNLIIASIMAMPLMLMLHLPFAMELVLASVIQFWFGRRFYLGAFHALKNRMGNMDLLIALGTSSAFGLSFFSPHPYFESSAMIIVLVRLGKYLELRAKMKTTQNLKALEALQPSTVRMKIGDQQFEMPIKGVSLGDQVVVLPGERVPLDGIVIEGESEIDESFLTGESRLQYKKSGDSISGGSLNANGTLVIQVRALGSQTLLSKIIRLIEDAQTQKAPIQKLVDRVSAVFVPVVLVIALVTFLIYGFQHGFGDEAWLRAISVLVIACPCALGLATPTALMVGTGLAAKHGVLIRDTESLERVHRLSALALDKTGTLTECKPRLVSIVTDDQDQALQVAIALQLGSEHPLAKAILKEGESRAWKIKPAKNITAIPGRGIQGEVDGIRYQMGSARLLRALNLSSSTHPESPEYTTAYLLSIDPPMVKAIFQFEDAIKAGAPELVQKLIHMGVKPVLMSGDGEVVARKVADRLGIHQSQGNLLPEDKARLIRELQSKGDVVAMLGDGINDAPALAAADVGIALSTGTDVAMQTAGMTLIGGDPMKVLDAIWISKKTYSKIRQNLMWAFAYNVIGIPLAAFGLLNPMIAGAAMAFSSVSVVANSLWLARERNR
jgi:Cu+-exporting ATPase